MRLWTLAIVLFLTCLCQNVWSLGAELERYLQQLYSMHHNPAHAISEIESQLSQQSLLDEEKSRLYILLIRVLIDNDELDKAQEVLHKLNSLQFSLSKIEQAWVKVSRSELYFAKGQYDQAMAELEQVLALAQQENMGYFKGVALSSAGAIHAVRFQYDIALPKLREAFNISELLDEPLLAIRVRRAMSYLYLRLDEPLKGIEYAEQSLYIAKQNNLLLAQLNDLFVLGFHYYRDGQYAKSLSHFSQLFDTAERLNSQANQAYGQYGIAISYRRLEQPQQALTWIEGAQSMEPLFENHYYRIDLWLQSARIYASNQMPKKAEQSLGRAQSLLEQFSGKLDQKLQQLLTHQFTRTRADVLLAQQEYKQAAEFLLRRVDEMPKEMRQIFNQSTQELKHQFELERLALQSQLQVEKSAKDSQALKEVRKHQRQQQVTLAVLVICLVIFAILAAFLYTARRKLARQMAAKSQFVANLSHELRTPLNSILGLTDLMNDTSLSELAQERLAQIKESSKTLLGIINDFLDISKIEAGKFTLRQEKFSLQQIMLPLHNVLEVACSNKPELSYSIVTSRDCPTYFIGDGLRIQQVLINLASNAAKFSQQGEILINCRCDYLEAERVKLVVQVVDSGIGMNEEQVARVFEAYHQAEDSTKFNFGGTGLGLAICAQLVSLMEGEIEVQSQPGEGSRFEIRIPLMIEPSTEQQQGSLTSSCEQALTENLLPGAKVLVVEDNLVNQMVIKKLLLQQDALVDIASNGQEAIDYLEENLPDIIVMDIQMPVMDGIEATRRIRRKFAWDKLPIVALTANTFNDEQEKCTDAGMDSFLSKPIESKRLFDELNRLLGKPRAEV